MTSVFYMNATIIKDVVLGHKRDYGIMQYSVKAAQVKKSYAACVCNSRESTDGDKNE